MSTLRSLERGVIRNQCYKSTHNNSLFHTAWENHHYTRRGLSKPQPKERPLTKSEMLMRMKMVRKLTKEAKEKREETVVND